MFWTTEKYWNKHWNSMFFFTKMFLLIRKIMFMNVNILRKIETLNKDVGDGHGRNVFILHQVQIKAKEEVLGDGISGRSVELWELLSYRKWIEPCNLSTVVPMAKSNTSAQMSSVVLGVSDLPALELLRGTCLGPTLTLQLCVLIRGSY